MAHDNETAPKFAYLHTTLTSGFNALGGGVCKNGRNRIPGSRRDGATGLQAWILHNRLEQPWGSSPARYRADGWQGIQRLRKPAIITNDRRSVGLPVVTR